MFGLGDIIGQAQKMRDEMQKIQEDLAKKHTEVSAGGGMIKVSVNGRQQILGVKLDPEVIKMGDVTMLQDLITSGVNAAIKASQEMAAEEMGRFTQSLGPLGSLLKGMGG